MTVSAIATALMAGMMVMVAALATIMASATASFATHVIEQTLYFLVRCLAVFYDMAFEIQVFACQWMVQVNSYVIFSYFKNLSKESLSFLVLQRQDGAFEHIFMVKMPIDAENLTL